MGMGYLKPPKKAKEEYRHWFWLSVAKEEGGGMKVKIDRLIRNALYRQMKEAEVKVIKLGQLLDDAETREQMNEAEVERLSEVIKILNALRRNDQTLTKIAEQRVRELEKGLAKAGEILEALNISVQWELADNIKKEINTTVSVIRHLLQEKKE